MPRFSASCLASRRLPSEEYGPGMAYADDILCAESVDGDCSDERGVDAAAKPDDDFAEAAFADVIAGADDQSAESGFVLIFD